MPKGPTALDLPSRGEIEVKGRLPASSNVTLLVECALKGATALAVYKPRKGERRLWDFAPGLWKREVAAYLLSETLGWGLVPLTVPREGPHGEGSLQLFIHADFEQHYFSLLEDATHHDTLRRICLFDLLANNADRKSGHCLLRPDGRIFAIDNGLVLHVDPKLRTVAACPSPSPSWWRRRSARPSGPAPRRSWRPPRSPPIPPACAIPGHSSSAGPLRRQ